MDFLKKWDLFTSSQSYCLLEAASKNLFSNGLRQVGGKGAQEYQYRSPIIKTQSIMKFYKVEYGCIRSNGQIDSNRYQIYLDLESGSESEAHAKLKARKDWQTSSDFVDVVIFKVTA